MSLDSYAMSLPDKDQREMYAFMIEAQTALDRFIAGRLFEGLKALFGDMALMEPGPFKTLNESSVLNWLTKKGKDKDWERVGAIFDAPVQPVALVLANEFAYMGVMGEQPDCVYLFLENIRKRAEQCGVCVGSLENES